MSASTGTGKDKDQSMISAGSAALRRAMSSTLGRHDNGADEPSVLPGPRVHHTEGDSINAIIEGEIIPQLLMAHAEGADQTLALGALNGAQIAPSAATKFALLPLHKDTPNLLEEVEKFLAEGVSVEAIYIDLLAPAARQLGEMWENDDCDFVDVTMGLWRLQEVMREIGERAPIKPPAIDGSAKRALFAPLPGDEHYFGALMMDEVFARSGWESQVMTKPLRKELLDVVSRESFDLVGLTVSRDCTSAALRNLIQAMRSVSANPNLSILIGGQMINQNPAIVAEVGADGTGADARAALEVARTLVQSAEVRVQQLK
ncbi:MAG: cobalamin-dependent protein [Pseudomonadota bacterium]